MQCRTGGGFLFFVSLGKDGGGTKVSGCASGLDGATSIEEIEWRLESCF